MAAACNAYRDVLRIAAGLRREGFLKHYKGDLVRHDKRSLRDHCGPYLWAIRESGTHVLTPQMACIGTNHRGAWDHIAADYYGKAQVFFSTGNGRRPRRVKNPKIPGAIAGKWDRACTQRYDLWTGKPINGGR
jgi:hypothetical protein